MPKAEIRRLLEELFESKRSPFFTHEPSFVRVRDADATFATLWFVEADYLPQREHVQKTSLFAFESATVATILVDGDTHVSEALPSPLQGFPGETTSREGAATGFRQLARRARQRLFVTKTDTLLTASAAVLNKKVAQVQGLEPLDVDPAVRMIFRLSELNDRLLEGFSDYLEREFIDAAVGIDLSQPDLSDDYIYSAIRDRMKDVREEDMGFVCQSDSRVVQTLQRGERTALFWRHRSGEGRQEGGTWAAGSCYARISSDFSPVRLDVVARSEELTERTNQIVGLLNKHQKIALGTQTLTAILGGQVAVPDFLFQALRDLEAHELTSNVRAFYINHGQTFS